MFSTRQQPTRGPWGLAVVLAVALAPSPAHAGNVFLRNDSKVPVVIHACSVQGKRVLRAKPCLLDPKSTSPALTLPGYRRVGLHVVFIGCFALMVLTVSVHVVLSHAGAGDLLRRSGWQLRTVAVLLFAALFSRMMVDFDMAHVRLWLGIAAGTFLASTLVWLQLSFRRHLQP